MSLRIYRHGSGPPLVLLHGVGHYGEAWQPVVDLLAADFDVIAVDLAGHGRSPALPDGAKPTIPTDAAAVAELFREHELGFPHLAGNSMGGAIALQLLLDGYAASATAFSPAGFWSAAEERFCELSLGFYARIPRLAQPAILRLVRTEPGRRVLLAQLFGSPSRLTAEAAVATLERAWAAPGFLPSVRSFRGYRFPAGRAAPSAPATVAWGRRDWLLPARPQAARARRDLPWAEHVILDTGHVPYFEDPGAVAQTIRGTIDRAQREARSEQR
jgi:pimeloyl-ACP methyl ester carboxylesterase